MTQQVSIDRDKAVVLIMDFQQRIVNNVAADPEGVIRHASEALSGARNAGIPVIYVVHRGGAFQEHAPDVEIHQGVTPNPGELVIIKTKPGPFSTTALDVTLREMGKDTLGSKLLGRDHFSSPDIASKQTTSRSSFFALRVRIRRSPQSTGEE